MMSVEEVITRSHNSLACTPSIEQLLDPAVSHADRTNSIVRALDLCVGSVADAVGRVGDVAQCMGLGGYRSAEGTVER